MIDRTGLLLANLISDERVGVYDSNKIDNNLIFLKNAPFYGNYLTVTYTNNADETITLVNGVDYLPDYELQLTDVPAGNTLWGVIRLLRPDLNGTVSTTYQSLGGRILVNSGQILTYENGNSYNRLTQERVLTTFADIYLAGNPNPWPISSFTTIYEVLIEKNTLILGAGYRALPANESLVQSGAVIETTAGLLINQYSANNTGGTGGTGGGTTSAVSVIGSALPLNAAQENGGNLAVIASKISGTVGVSVNNTSAIVVDGSGVTQPVSLATLPALPTGTNHIGSVEVANFPATQAVSVTNLPSVQHVSVDNLPAEQAVSIAALPSLAAGTNHIGSVDVGNFPANQTVTVSNLPSVQHVSVDNLPATQAVSGTIGVSNFPSTQEVTGSVSINGTPAVSVSGVAAISATALPLPTGAATAAKQPALGVAGTPSTDVLSVQGVTNGVALKVDGSSVTQPISGSVSVTGTTAVSAATLPLPTGASTEATLSSLSGKVPANLTVNNTRLLIDGSGVTQPVSGSVSVTGTTAISAASLPLPTGAATAAKQPAFGTAGTPSSDVVTVQGSTSMTALKVDGSGVTQPVSVAALPALATGSNTIGSVGIVGTVPVSGSFYQATQPVSIAALPALPSGSNAIGSVSISNFPSTQGVSSTQLPASLGQKTAAGSLPVVLASDQTTLNVASSGGSLALDSSIQSLINTIKATKDFSTTIWFDNTVNPPVYYVRREVLDEGAGTFSVTWETPSGSAATPDIGKLVSISNAQQINQQSANYTATGSGAGYVSSDLLVHIYGIDTALSTPAVAYSFWFNASQGTTLSTPPTNDTYSNTGASSVSVTSSVLAANAAQETGGNLASISTASGSTADAAYGGSGSTTLVGGLKGVYAAIKGALNIRALTSGTDSVTTVPSGTQSISAASLPLPSGAALESGNLASIASTNTTIANAQGTSATGVTQLTGGTGILGWLSGIYSRLTNGVTIGTLPSLPTGSNSIGTVGVNSLPALPAGANAIGSVTVSNLPATQAVSAASLPLPSGAATEAGNLATINTSNNAISAAAGTTADAVYTGSGNATMVSAIKGVYAAVKGSLNIRALTSGTDSVTIVPSGTQSVSLTTLPALASGTNAIGSVSVNALPAIPSGTNNIGKVDINSLPALPSGANAIGSVTVSNLPSTQPVSVVALPLPTDAATAAKQPALGTAGTPSADVITVQGIASGTALKVDGSAVTQPVSGTVSITGTHPVTVSGTAAISATTLPLPTGAASETTLSALSTKVPSNLTVTNTRLLVDGSGVTQPVSGSVTVSGTVASTQSGNWSTRVQDGTGASISSIADGAGITSLATAIGATNFIASVNNSSTTQLASTATYTGTIESIFNQQAISVLLTTDQPGTLTLNQYIDLAGNRRICQWVFPIAAGVPFSRAFVANGNYFNLSFQNTGAAATTTLNINTAYGTLPAASNLGNLPIALNEINGAALGLGQATMAASLPVVLSSNQSAVPVSGSFFPSTQPVSATSLPLPAGAATETGNLAAINTSNAAMNTATGSISDSAYTGTGNASQVALLKGLYAAVRGPDAFANNYTLTLQRDGNGRLSQITKVRNGVTVRQVLSRNPDGSLSGITSTIQ